MKRLTEAASSVSLTVRIPAALRERLERAAHERWERPSTLVREALEAFLDGASSVQRPAAPDLSTPWDDPEEAPAPSAKRPVVRPPMPEPKIGQATLDRLRGMIGSVESR